ncbi:MAG: MBL fold metallo-hydrolase [Patescibacteria group bacterium]|jgi:L-ascorbate metabolism protein UlaG (beta-lactamase superfamily)|nr:MBL fold metallo-hydrolase [bacterium]HQC49999.1 MBL fold metallo-hydrolase [bacterium]
MIITWQGHSCFKIQDKIGPDGVTVITDPFSKEVGLKVPNCEADIVTISHDHYDHNNSAALRGQPLIINCAGEYDYKGILVEGIDSFHDDKEGKERGLNVIYRFEVEDISIVHLGDLGSPLDNGQLEKLAGTDILLIPVGGKYTLDAKKAVEVISQIEPRIVIPMHYKIKDLKIDIDPVDKFIKEIGVEPTYEEKLKISKKDLPQEDMELVILSI